jgi:Rad3-related DNA helicase
VSILPPPCDIGAPDRYRQWRHLQAEAVLAAADSPKRFIIQGAPTGFGKSLVYVSQAILTDARACILTSTKALMAQLGGDFRESGLIEIRGLNSYECIEGQPTGRFGDVRREGYRADRGLPMMCDEAPCQAGANCHRRESGCLYYDAYHAASNRTSRLVVTNYAYWMSIHRFGEGLGKFDLLILDEAHQAVDELGGFIGTELRPSEVESVLPVQAHRLPSSIYVKDWVEWGSEWNTFTVVALESIRAQIKASESGRGRINYATLKRARDLRNLSRKLQTISSMHGAWVIDHIRDDRGRTVTKFDPVWPGEYAESTLFLDIKKVVMVSATVRPKTAEMLGVPRHLLDFKEYPSTFHRDNRPVIFVPTAHMNRGSAMLGKREWHTRMDQIIARRPDTKGIIHTVSYKRALEVYGGSDFKERMLLHDSTDTRDKIEQFKRSTQPLILVSPVMTTGYDFPYDQARWQIIAKVPFPVTVDKIMKARAERDKGYKDYVTMVALVQTAGRICRAEDDWGETIIVDSDFGWWWAKCKHLCPSWFNESVRKEDTLGMPLLGPIRPG